MRLKGSAVSREISRPDAGVRNKFYARERPKTGAVIYEIEWSRRHLEDAALAVLRDVVARWPLA
jgi:hypothetical protein